MQLLHKVRTEKREELGLQLEERSPVGQAQLITLQASVVAEAGAWLRMPPPTFHHGTRRGRRIFLGSVCKFCRDFNFHQITISKLPSQVGYLNLSPTFPSRCQLTSSAASSSPAHCSRLLVWNRAELPKVIRKRGPTG